MTFCWQDTSPRENLRRSATNVSLLARARRAQQPKHHLYTGDQEAATADNKKPTYDCRTDLFASAGSSNLDREKKRRGRRAA